MMEHNHFSELLIPILTIAIVITTVLSIIAAVIGILYGNEWIIGIPVMLTVLCHIALNTIIDKLKVKNQYRKNIILSRCLLGLNALALFCIAYLNCSKEQSPSKSENSYD